jgi:hypothetical protein
MNNSDRLAKHVYGGKAALTIDPSLNRYKTFHTVTLDLAPRRGGETDWQHKISIQPTYQELPLLVALFLGYHSHLHIRRDEKWMEVIDQEKSVFIKGGGGNSVFALPVMPGDRIWLSAMLLQEYAKNFPDMAPALLIASLQTARTVGRRTSQSQDGSGGVISPQ